MRSALLWKIGMHGCTAMVLWIFSYFFLPSTCRTKRLELVCRLKPSSWTCAIQHKVLASSSQGCTSQHCDDVWRVSRKRCCGLDHHKIRVDWRRTVNKGLQTNLCCWGCKKCCICTFAWKYLNNSTSKKKKELITNFNLFLFLQVRNQLF